MFTIFLVAWGVREGKFGGRTQKEGFFRKGKLSNHTLLSAIIVSVCAVPRVCILVLFIVFCLHNYALKCYIVIDLRTTVVNTIVFH